MSERSAAPRRIPAWLLDALFVLLLCVYVASGRASVPFHGDESTFVWMSRDAHALLEGVRPGSLAFEASPREPYAQWLRVLNGSLTPLAIGLAGRAAGFTRADLNDPWIWVLPGRPHGAQWRVNVSGGRLPDTALLHSARLPSALFAGASVALVFALARSLSRSRAAAWIAATAYATTPALLLNGRRAMQEGGLLLASALLVGAALLALRSRARDGGAGPTPGWLLALAAATSAAVAAKHSAAAVAAPAWLAVAALPWLRGERPDLREAARHLTLVAGAGVASLALFTLWVPVWWSPPRTLALAALAALAGASALRRAPRAAWSLRGAALAGLALAHFAQPALFTIGLAHTRHLVAERRALVREQTAKLDRSLAMRATTLAREAFGAPPQFFEDPAWAGFPEIRRQIDAYRGSLLAGRPDSLHWPVAGLLALLAAVGAAELARRGPAAERALLLAWPGALALVLLANPLPWQRYYLLLHAPIALLAGHGAARLLASRRGEA